MSKLRASDAEFIDTARAALIRAIVSRRHGHEYLRERDQLDWILQEVCFTPPRGKSKWRIRLLGVHLGDKCPRQSRCFAWIERGARRAIILLAALVDALDRIRADSIEAGGSK